MIKDDIKILADKVGVPIRKLSAETMAKVNDAPQGQKKTSKHKKVVKIVEDLIFKGPFVCDDKKLMNSLSFNYALDVLEDALQLPEWQRGSLPWEYVGNWNNNQFYLVGTNVGKRNGISFDIVSTKIEKDVKVVPRNEHVSRVSDLEGTALLTGAIKLASLQHLYLRFLLDLGDSGTHNILVRKDYGDTGRLVAGIDLEEKRGIKVKESQLDHLFKTVASRKQHALYQSDVCKIKTLFYDQLDQQVLERLDSMGIDLKRLQENIHLWGRLK
jgi:hypothetical protein